MKIFEYEPEGLEGEPARTRVFLKLTIIYIVSSVLLLGISEALRKTVYDGFARNLFFIFGAMGFFGSCYFAARTIYHGITWGVVSISEPWKPVSQVVVALTVATLPFVIFLGSLEISSELFRYNYTSISLWLGTIFVSWIFYRVYLSMKPPLVPVRSFLATVAFIALLVFVSAHGGFDSDDYYDYAVGENSSTNASLIDPKSPEGKRDMARNYLRLITAAYLGLLVGMMKLRSSKYNLEIKT